MSEKVELLPEVADAVERIRKHGWVADVDVIECELLRLARENAVLKARIDSATVVAFDRSTCIALVPVE